MTHKAKWIGLTGGMGVGKTIAADLFQRQGVAVINLDDVGRQMADEAKVITFYEKLLGPSVVSDGKLDRKKVKELLFQSTSKQSQAERFLHPLIWSEFQKKALALEKAGSKLVICEAALIVEAKLHPHLDELILVEAPLEIRRARIKARDQLPETVIDAILAKQLSDEKKRPLATHIVVNTGSRESFERDLGKIVEGWKQKGWC